jgi:hypothetical protein
MADERQSSEREPRGFSEHTRKSPSENAHEQGWGLNEETRTNPPEGKQDWEGGADYEYGARDFGDTAVDTSAAEPAPEAINALRKGAASEAAQQPNDQRTSINRG